MSSAGPDMQYGPLSPSESSFRGVCMLLAGHPAYEHMPVRRLPEFLHVIERQQTFCAVDGDVLKGLVIWHPIDSEVARESIRQRRWPPGKQPPGDAGARVLGAFIAPSPDQARPFFRRFMQSCPGKVLLLERHYPNRAQRFVWVDRSGRVFGDDV